MERLPMSTRLPTWVFYSTPLSEEKLQHINTLAPGTLEQRSHTRLSTSIWDVSSDAEASDLNGE